MSLNTKSILLVDDEYSLRLLVKTLLEKNGYQVYAAASAEAALSIWHDRHKNIALVVTDVLLPRMSGPDMIKKMSSDGAHAKYLFITGNDEDIDPGNFPNCIGSLMKPFTINELLDAVSLCANYDEAKAFAASR